MHQVIDKQMLSHVQQKIGELWSTKNKVSMANVYTPKINSAQDFG